jgi:hypothetical protein
MLARVLLLQLQLLVGLWELLLLLLLVVVRPRRGRSLLLLSAFGGLRQLLLCAWQQLLPLW